MIVSLIKFLFWGFIGCLLYMYSIVILDMRARNAEIPTLEGTIKQLEVENRLLKRKLITLEYIKNG